MSSRVRSAIFSQEPMICGLGKHQRHRQRASLPAYPKREETVAGSKASMVDGWSVEQERGGG
jgi:hypothetical protein